jgi:acyl-coenzyme A thioesterase PaaI-like protein
MQRKAIQDLYPEKYSHCYGCGRLNDDGLKIRSYWEGEESVCSFTPRPEHTAFPGFVYGGLIASVIDCHSTGTAAMAAYRREGREFGSGPALRFVTGSMHVDFLKPTPLGPPLELRSRVKEIGERKVIVETDLSVNGVLCARGSVVAVKIPESMGGEKKD